MLLSQVEIAGRLLLQIEPKDAMSIIWVLATCACWGRRTIVSGHAKINSSLNIALDLSSGYMCPFAAAVCRHLDSICWLAGKQRQEPIPLLEKTQSFLQFIIQILLQRILGLFMHYCMPALQAFGAAFMPSRSSFAKGLLIIGLLSSLMSLFSSVGLGNLTCADEMS